MPHFSLEIAHLAPEALTFWVEQVKEQGCTFATLEELATQQEQIYWLHQECRKRQPPVETRQEPQDYEKWVETFCTGPQACPALYHVLMLDRQKIGVSVLIKADTPNTLLCGFTGILPAFGGRGLALALKSQTLLTAKEVGVKHVITSVRADNPSMLTLNRRLGFVPVE